MSLVLDEAQAKLRRFKRDGTIATLSDGEGLTYQRKSVLLSQKGEQRFQFFPKCKIRLHATT
jgi:hypothetical protein